MEEVQVYGINSSKRNTKENKPKEKEVIYIMEKIKGVKYLIKNQDEIKKEATPIINDNLCDMCRKKMIRNNLMNVPVYKIFSPDYHSQIDRTLCRKCKINLKNAMSKKNGK